MNKKQFVNMLKVWDEDFLKAREPLEALTSFLKRLKRANERQETDIKKISDVKTIFNSRIVTFIEKKSGVKYQIIIDYDLNKVSLLY